MAFPAPLLTAYSQGAVASASGPPGHAGANGTSMSRLQFCAAVANTPLFSAWKRCCAERMEPNIVRASDARARSAAFKYCGNAMDAKIAIIITTINSSSSVNPSRLLMDPSWLTGSVTIEPPPASPGLLASFHATARHLKDRHEDGQDDDEDQPRHHHNGDRLKQPCHPRDERLHACLVVPGDPPAHLGQLAHFLADLHHLHGHGRKHPGLIHRLGHGLALLHGLPHLADGLAVHSVRCALLENLQTGEQRDPALQQRGDPARELRQLHVAKQDAEQRELQHDPVAHPLPSLTLEIPLKEISAR